MSTKEVIFGEVFDVRENSNISELFDDIDIFKCSTPYTFMISCGEFVTLPFGMNYDGGDYYYCGFETRKEAEDKRQEMIDSGCVTVVSEMTDPDDEFTLGIVDKVFKNPEDAHNYVLSKTNNDDSWKEISFDFDLVDRLVARLVYSCYFVEFKQLY